MRKIIHLDMDCFYAAVEMRDDPSLVGRPIAVGGGSPRGVVATCNYEARKFGVRSAISGDMARRLCPQIEFVVPNFDKYKHESNTIRKIMLQTTPIIEPLSLDEAYLDVTDCTIYHKGEHHNSATLIAKDLKRKIYEATKLRASAGVAPNKFLAKIASDWDKPDGLKVITPEEVDDFVRDLPVGKIPGVGKVSVEKLAKRGIKLCKDLRKYKQEELRGMFGKFGDMLYYRSHGIDERRVTTERIRKSLSVETTFIRDLDNDKRCAEEIEKLLREMNKRLAKHKDEYDSKGIFVKVKFSDFVITTKQAADKEANLANALALYNEARQRHNKPVRLLGVGVYCLPKGDDQKTKVTIAKHSDKTSNTGYISKGDAIANYSLFQ